MSPSTARRWVTRAVVVGGVLVLALVLGAGVELLRIRADLDHGRSQLSGLSLEQLRRTGLQPTLADAAHALDAAADRASSSPFLRAVSIVPVLDEQVAGLQDLTATADLLGDEALRTGTRIEAALDRAGDEPARRVDLLDVVLDELDRIETLVADVDVGADGWLVPPLHDARTSVVEALDSVPDRFAPLETQVRALRELLVGPSSYLVMVGNNAEMRAGAGMPLQVGVARIGAGDIELGEFKAATSELFAPEPSGPFNARIPETLAETYPRWMIGKDFPETAVVPNFPITAPIFADIAADTQGWHTDGAIHIDAIALAEILRVVGPVTVHGVEYSADTAAEIVLNRTYLAFDGIDRDVRRDAQSLLARALFEAIEQRDVDLLDVVGALQRAAQGRHFMAWSRDGTLQELFESFGAAGAVSPFHTLVSVQNTGANKLDWYIRPRVDVRAEPRPGSDQWQVTMTVTVHHPDRELTVGYIEGPFPELAGGQHRTLVTVQLPAAATVIDMPDEEVTEYGNDGTSWVIGTRVVVPRGEERQVVTTFRLPREMPGLAVLPSARAFPVPWTVAGTRHQDTAPFVARFGRFEDGPTGPELVLTAMGAIVGLAGASTLLTAKRRSAANVESGGRRRIDLLTAAGLLAVAALLAGVGLLV